MKIKDNYNCDSTNLNIMWSEYVANPPEQVSLGHCFNLNTEIYGTDFLDHHHSTTGEFYHKCGYHHSG